MKYTLFYSLANIFNRSIQILSIFLIIKVYSISDTARYSLFFPSIQILMPLLSLASFNLMLKFGFNSKLKAKNYLNISNSIVFYLGCTFLLITLITYLDNWIIYIVIFAIFETLFQNFLHYFRTQNKYYEYFFSSFSKSILFVIILGLSVLYTIPLDILFILFICINMFVLSILILRYKSILFFLSFIKVIKIYRKYYYFLVPIFVNFLLMWLSNNSDRYLVAWLLDDKDLAILSIALSLAQSAFFINIIYMYMLSEMSLKYFDRYLKQSFYKNKIIFVSILSISFYICILLAIYIDSTYFKVLNLIDLVTSVRIFSLGYIAFFIYNYYYYYYNIFYVQRKTAFVTKLNLVMVSSNIILTIPILKYLNIEFAIFITLIINYIFILLLHYFSKKSIEKSKSLLALENFMILMMILISVVGNYAFL